MLPLALGVAISPIPIVAAILMLLSPRATRTSIGFLAGWVAGVVVVVTAATVLSALLPSDDPDASKPIKGAVTILLGSAMLLRAARQWRGRPQASSSLPSRRGCRPLTR